MSTKGVWIITKKSMNCVDRNFFTSTASFLSWKFDKNTSNVMAQLMWSVARKLARIRSLLIVHPHIHNVRMRQKSVVLDVNQLGTPSRWFVKVVQFLGKLMYCVLLVTTLKAHKRVMYGIVPHSSKSTYPFSIALDQQAISSIWTCAVDHQSLLAYKIYIANGHCCCRSETLDSVWNKRNHMYATNWMSYHCVLWYSHHTQVFSHSHRPEYTEANSAHKHFAGYECDKNVGNSLM